MSEQENIWETLDGTHVVIQLKASWIGVSHPNQPMVQETTDGSQLYASIPVVRGRLQVAHDAEGKVMLHLVMADPDSKKQSLVHLWLREDMVDFITATEVSLAQ